MTKTSFPGNEFYVSHGHGTRTRLRAETHFGVQARSRHFVGNKGFTLIEIIILIAMAGILLPAIIVPFVSSVKGSAKPEMAATAMFLAQQKMEEFLKFDYTDSTLNPIALTSYAGADITGYQWQWEISLVDNNFNTSGTNVGYKRIFVRVRDPESDTYEIYSVVTDFQ